MRQGFRISFEFDEIIIYLAGKINNKQASLVCIGRAWDIEHNNIMILCARTRRGCVCTDIIRCYYYYFYVFYCNVRSGPRLEATGAGCAGHCILCALTLGAFTVSRPKITITPRCKTTRCVRPPYYNRGVLPYDDGRIILLLLLYATRVL